MAQSRSDVLEYLLNLLRTLADDLGDSGDITEETYILADMNWSSIEVVVLADTIQQHYGRVFPFTEFLQEMGERDVRDITVGELADFIHGNLESAPAPEVVR